MNKFIRMYKAVEINHFKGLPQHLTGDSKLQSHIVLKDGREHLLTDIVKSAKATGRN